MSDNITTAPCPQGDGEQVIDGYSPDGFTAKLACGHGANITDLAITQVAPSEPDAELPTSETPVSSEDQPEPSPLRKIDQEVNDNITAFIQRQEGQGG